jgi:N-acetylmuramoyl-L-alanine amidase
LNETLRAGNVRAMKFFSALTILFFLFCVSSSHAVFINGQNYVSLTDFARANNFHVTYLNREIILSNKNSRLVFDADSAQSQINGINVRLSFPVANAKGVALISQLDLDTAIKPLIFPQKIFIKKITTICLDPGHGGKDSGNRVGFGFFGHSEKTYTLALALELRDQLKKLGFNVILTRNGDNFVELPVRPAIANKIGADLFISLHFNATQTGKSEVQGPETYCITPIGATSSNAHGEAGEFSSSIGTGPTIANRSEQKSLLLAYQMQKSLVQSLRVEDRGVRRARFAVLRDAQMTAILIEGGYMTHPTESKKIYDSAYRKQMATAIVKGIVAYQKLTMPPIPPPLAAPNKNKVSNVKKAK